MEITGVSGVSDVEIVDNDKIGFASLTSEEFMRLLIVQLQNQDPTEPVGNEEILNQIAMMRNLQSDLELSDALKAITKNDQLTTAAAFIGKSVTGRAADQSEVSGLVDRAYVRGGEAFLGVGSREIQLNRVESVNLA